MAMQKGKKKQRIGQIRLKNEENVFLPGIAGMVAWRQSGVWPAVQRRLGRQVVVEVVQQ